MSITIILAHPDKGSFSHAISQTVKGVLQRDGYDVILHDLYAEEFPSVLPAEELAREPVLPPAIALQCQEIKTAEGIVIIHPNWWGQPPAILKGWVDRVLRTGIAYKFVGDDKGEGIPVGLLKAKTALVFNTSNTPQARELSVFGDPLETLWKNCIFDLCGVKRFYRRNFGVIATSTAQQREKWLEEAQEITREYFPKVK
jgi:NAD(P)H dehydrogenase (quinone)